MSAVDPRGEFSIGGDLWPGISKLVEECGEATDVLPELILMRLIGRVEQVAGKIFGARGDADHWDGSHLPTRLTEELGDLLAAIDFVVIWNGLDQEALAERKAAKSRQFNEWHAHGNPPRPEPRDRVGELLAYNNGQVSKRRAATDLLREVLESCHIDEGLRFRIETFVAEVHR